MRDLIIGGLYRHFKNRTVKVLHEAYDSETLEKIVVYVHLDEGSIWVRPKNMFLGQVTRQSQTFDRFIEVKENSPDLNQ